MNESIVTFERKVIIEKQEQLTSNVVGEEKREGKGIVFEGLEEREKGSERKKKKRKRDREEERKREKERKKTTKKKKHL